MSLMSRLALAASGCVVVLIAFLQLRSGHAVFINASYHQQTFAAAGFGVGLLLVTLAVLPPSGWTYRKITTRKSRLKPH